MFKKSEKSGYTDQIRDCRISLVVTQDVYDQLQKERYKKDVTMNQYLNEIIENRNGFDCATRNSIFDSMELNLKFLKTVYNSTVTMACMLGMENGRFPEESLIK